ncbi:tRNA synthetases class I (R)-domain-containing protein [Dunaliella salina]|uniref:arginine--tRNA ligase n=1 Tax=Dunaliella salina TaxID=3046 RepID=A0ABQ7G0G6_DUNSA|nr:tRNA synthetases class I (R)-domain-containing protein [Dunaliella salina]|eukprot:KAF5828098.1 tRNA synthetases class I (R)-domain-containing protein [Dunaliella salina]
MLNKSYRVSGGQKLSSPRSKPSQAVPRSPFPRLGAALLGSRSLPAFGGGKQFIRRPSHTRPVTAAAAAQQQGTNRRRAALEEARMNKDLQAAGSLRTQLTNLFRLAINKAYPDLTDEPVVAACNNPKFGDYQCNNAMQLFAKLKGKEGAPKAPRDVASALVANLPPNELLSETSLAGPGFINIRLSNEFLSKRVSEMLKLGLQPPFSPDLSSKKCVVDFSSPNVAKEMHVGHLRSTIIGDTICRTLELCGAQVLRLNHIGDWGTQFGMLIQHMSELTPSADGGATGDESISDLMELYRAAKKRFDEDEGFKQRAREAVTALQSGDEKSLRMWRAICAASRKEFAAIYERLGVRVEERGESFYNPMLKAVVEELKEKGCAEESDGAICVFVEGQSIPLIVQKSDGGFGYASTDMAAIKHRLEVEKADWIIYVTDAGQAQHFDLVFSAAKKAGWIGTPESKAKIDHVGFGLVLGEDGKKFKTRSGDVVRLVELLDEAKARCTDTIRTRSQETGETVDEASLEHAASAMGYGAVKYADLKSHRMTNYKFSFDSMLDLKGNTAVYLLYAHARIAGIARKAEKDIDALAASTPIVVAHQREVDLALHLSRFPEAMEDMLQELTPNRLTDYLYELSERFNAFYVDCKVLGSEEEGSRLQLVEATARVMRQCFSLLGLIPLYRI